MNQYDINNERLSFYFVIFDAFLSCFNINAILLKSSMRVISTYVGIHMAQFHIWKYSEAVRKSIYIT